MHVAITGASGLVGSSLASFLSTGGHSVSRMIRPGHGAKSGDVFWDPKTGSIESGKLEGIDAVVHLAGENLFGLWTESKRRRIRESRVQATQLLCQSLAKLERKPKVFLSASAVGFYGDRGAERLNEDSTMGTGFLAELCRDWEAATGPMAAAGTRVAHMRFGIVLSPKGGALSKMLLPFKLGLGGTLGDGSQYMSWIAIDDAISGIHHVLVTDALRGPVNGVAPNPVTNREFTKTLGKVLSRPTVLPVPAFILKTALRDLAKEVLLGGQRVEPARLTATNHRFKSPELEGALRQLLGK